MKAKGTVAISTLVTGLKRIISEIEYAGVGLEENGRLIRTSLLNLGRFVVSIREHKAAFFS